MKCTAQYYAGSAESVRRYISSYFKDAPTYCLANLSLPNY